MEEKRYYCKVSAEFGRIVNGEKVPKNPVESVWLDLTYGEAVAFQAMVLKPMVDDMTSDSLELGIRKAVLEGTMDKGTAAELLNAIGKQGR